MTKICTKCCLKKATEMFDKDKSGKMGLRSICKSCRSEYNKQYVKDNALKIEIYRKAYQEENKEKIAKYQKDWRKKNSEHVRKYREENKELRHETTMRWRKNNRKQYRGSQNKWRAKKIKEDIGFKLSCSVRTRISGVIQKGKKSTTTAKLVGCTTKELRNHLESQFTDGMSWDNYGLHGWHIDHIIPCASFDLSDPEQQRQCFHYTNLQPLWAKDNLKKGDKITNNLNKIKAPRGCSRQD